MVGPIWRLAGPERRRTPSAAGPALAYSTAVTDPRTELAALRRRARTQRRAVLARLTELERELAARRDDAMVARACLAHAEVLLAAREPSLEDRELARRKVLRAAAVVDELDDAALLLEVARLRLRVEENLPAGTPTAVVRAARQLIDLLAATTGDSRVERARAWQTLARVSMPYTHEGPPPRSAAGTTEAGLRTALALALDAADVELAVELVRELLVVLSACRAQVACDELVAEASRALPVAAADELAALLERWGSDHGGLRARVVRLHAALVARASSPGAGSAVLPLAVGDDVVHPTLGAGRVVAITAGARRIASVTFADGAVVRLVETALTRS